MAIRKSTVGAAYKQRFTDWVYTNLLGVKLEISSRPPTSQGFVPVQWRWVTERTFGTFSFFRKLDRSGDRKDHEKTTQSAEAWVLWQNCQVILNRLQA